MTEAEKIKIALYKQIFKDIKHGYIAVPELSLFSAVADMIVVNGDIHIYEIKSKADSLSRLNKQIERFKKCANRVTIVADEKFIPTLLDNKDLQDIGLISVNHRNQLKVVKDASFMSMGLEDYLAYWTTSEIKMSLRGLEGHSKLNAEESKQKLLSLLTPQELKNITLYKVKEKYGKEFIERASLIKEKKFEEALQARFQKLLPTKITPLKMLPAYLFKDFA
jgi:hypothetical protein